MLTASGKIYEVKNMKTAIKRVPAMIVAGLLYGLYYDIHAAQAGTPGTPDGRRMQKVNFENNTPIANTYRLISIRSGRTPRSILTKLSTPIHSSKS